MRGVNILGVSSTNYPNKDRNKVWGNLSKKYKPTKLRKINKNYISLEEVIKFSEDLIYGKNFGRTILKIS
jgi:NADPH:quinone reductase-like Zn-dependent oxidoreductase